MSPTTLTDDEERDALRALARGYMRGAITSLTATPASGRAAIDEAVTAGVFAGGVHAILERQAPLSPQDAEDYGEELAAALFAGLGEQGALLSTTLGAPGYEDLTTFATTVVRGQLTSLPAGLPRDEVLALAAFGAGAIDGTTEGLVTSFPHGVPAPSEAQMRAWLQELGGSDVGTAPWDRAALDLLFVYADTAAATTLTTIADAEAYADTHTPPPVLAQISAWGKGLANGAYAHLAEADASARAADAEAYARGLAGPGLAHILAADPGGADPDAISAWAAGLSAGLSSLTASTSTALGLSESYLGDLTSAVAAFPADVGPGQTALLTQFGAGLTTRLSTRMGTLGAAVGPDDQTALTGIARGLAEGAVGLAGGPALENPQLARALGDGYAQGFLETRSARALVDDAQALSAAAQAWFAAGPPVSVGAISTLLQDTARDPYHAITAYGKEMGRAPIAWADGKGLAPLAVQDAVWIGEAAETTAYLTIDAMSDADAGITEAELQRSEKATRDYAGVVAGHLYTPDVAMAIANLTGEETERHAMRFVTYLLVPLDWAAHSEGAGAAMLDATLENGKAIERFRDVQFAAAAIAAAEAMGEGITSGPAPIPADAEPTVKAWVSGMTGAILDVPIAALDSDLQARLAWLRATSGAVVPVTKRMTDDQLEATKLYGHQVGAWAFGADDHVPDMEGADAALQAWAHATVGRGLAALPPTMTEEEMQATVAYLGGIQRAAEKLPTPDVTSWTLPDLVAMDAYVGGISDGAGLVAEETRLLMCAWGMETTAPCPEKEDDDVEPPCETDCPPPPPPPEEPGCDDACALDLYIGNLDAWANTLVASGPSQIPSTEPTLTGTAFVARWASEVLAGHGVCSSAEDPAATCDGPRGPAETFAAARRSDVEAYAASLGSAYASFIDLEDPSQPGLVRPVSDPLLVWADGIQQGQALGFLDPAAFVPGGDGETPGSPFPAPPTREEDLRLAALGAWTIAMYEAAVASYDDLYVPFPDTTPLNATADGIDALVADAIWRGGADAIFDSADAALAYAEGAVPAEAIDAFALGLVRSTEHAILDPAQTDLAAILHWYRGFAEGGATALGEGAAQIEKRQVPAIQAYAELMASALEPPAPPEPQILGKILAPEEEPEEDEGGSGGSGGSDPAPEPEPEPSAEEIYLENLQAHADGIGRAVLAAPVPREDLDAYALTVLAYLDSVKVAALASPPVSPDAGYAARLRDWTQAQAEGALVAKPPTTAERLTPQPDLDLAMATIEGLASTLPWNLPPDADENAAWAQAAVIAITQLECPPEMPSEPCVALGAALAQALGQTLPTLPAPALPLADEQAALASALQGILDGLGAEVPAPPALAPIAEGILQGALASVPDASGADATYAAIAREAAGLSAEIPPELVGVYAQVATEAALDTPPSQRAALIQRLAAIAGAHAQSESAMRAALAQATDESATTRGAPIVQVSDGARTLHADELDGDARLDGLVDATVTLYESSASASGSTYELSWRVGDSPATLAPMAGAEGIFRATIRAADLAAAPRGARLEFTIVERSAAVATEHSRDGAPFAFVPDRDAPVVSLAPAAAPTGASLRLAWSGEDGDGSIASYRVQVRADGGEWRDWIASTAATSATFTGEPGRAYAFRASARDSVGHVSAPSAEAQLAVPAGAPANQPPAIRILAPTAASVLGSAIAVELDASDPDGTPPMVRVCIQRADFDLDLSCPHEGEALSVTLDAAGLADGRYRLRAIATDGTRSAEATSAAFTLDRTGPVFRGALADGTPTRVLVSASLDADARSVTVTTGGRTIALTDDGRGVDARGRDGSWTGATTLPPGEHTLVFRAADARGNEATITRTVVVPAAPASAPAHEQPPAASAPPAAATPPAPTPDVAPEPARDVPGLGALALVAGVAALALARRRR